eukprot:g2805.t1
MAVAGTRESWDNGGLTFGLPSVGGGAEQEEEVLDDRAILKAFDDALNTHTRKPVDGVEARKWNKHAAKEVAAQAGSSRVPSLTAAAAPRGTTTTASSNNAGLSSASPAASAAAAAAAAAAASASGYQQGHGQGFQAADRRFASLLAKGSAEASSRGAGGGEARVLPAGIPGPWEPVAGPDEAHQHSREVPPDDRGRRLEYARPGPSEVYPLGEDYGNGAHASYSSRAAPQYPPPPYPPGGAAAGFEEGGLGRHGLPPPPHPPHPGMGPHAAAFQSLDGVPDDDLADLLLAWYYSGYYTGRYRAMQEARKPRNYYRRNYPPPPSAGGHGVNHHGHGGPPTPSSAYHGGGEGWGGDPSGGGWHGPQQQQHPRGGAPGGPPPTPTMQSSPGGMAGRGSFGRRGS